MAMADITKTWKKLESDVYTNLIKLVWGDTVQDEVFLRWAQGFQFTEGEPSALMQISGGPCAVIAPVQAYILKNMLFAQENTEETVIDLKAKSTSETKKVLGDSLLDILGNVAKGDTVKLIVHSNHCTSTESTPSTSHDSNCDGESSHKRPKLFSCNDFHKQLVYKEYLLESFKDSIDWYVEHVMGDFGVLSLLYSALYTYGLDKIKAVVDESLIDSTHGHGGQCLVNLLLTGEATAHVFDGEKDAGGLKLMGVSTQSQIGFLTLMESHRYIEVGWHLKSPLYPIWIIGSETHLTVLFSQDKEAVSEDKKAAIMKVVNSYDTEGNGFINSAYLSDLMSSLNLLSEPEEYVDIIKNKLDSEGLGIILVSSFMEEFFPRDQNDNDEPKTFYLYHYNGIKRSNNSNKIEYHRAKATLRDFLEPTVVTDSSSILKCLQTKWPTIELQWDNEIVPSVN